MTLEILCILIEHEVGYIAFWWSDGGCLGRSNDV